MGEVGEVDVKVGEDGGSFVELVVVTSLLFGSVEF